MAEADLEFADWAPRLGLLEMSDDRRALIWGLYRLAAWVADHPEVPVPDVEASVWPGNAGWEAECAVVDEVAAALDVPTKFKAAGDHYEARARLGRVDVRSTAIRPERKSRFDAERSYRGCVTPDIAGGGEGR